MAVKLVSAVCPSCGAQIEVPPDRAVCYCTYCGGQIMIDDGSQTINIHNYDEADLRRIELEAEELKWFGEERAAYEKRHRTWRFAVVGWAVLMVVLFILAGVVDGENVVYGAVAASMLGALIFGPIALFVLRPRKPKLKR